MKFAVILMVSLLATQDPSPEVHWGAYAQATLGAAPTPWLVEALQTYAWPTEAGAWALDLGCGTGRDTRFLAAQSMRVMAIDANADALHALRAQLPHGHQARVQSVQACIEDLAWPQMAETFALVNATYALPFVQAGALEATMHGIARVLRPGGLFVGQFFGAGNWVPNATQQTVEQVRALLGDAVCVLTIIERVGLGPTATQGKQHWHVYHVVARKLAHDGARCPIGAP